VRLFLPPHPVLSSALINSCSSFGVAFENLPKNVPLYPAISLKHYQTSVVVNFGSTPFRHLPSDCQSLIHMPECLEREEQIARESSECQNERSFFATALPVEILLLVFSFLDPGSLAKIGRVNRKCAKFANTPEMWANAYHNRMPLSLARPILPHEYKERAAARHRLETGLSTLSESFPCKYFIKCLQFDNEKLICGAGSSLAVFENYLDHSTEMKRRLVDGHVGPIEDLVFDGQKIYTASSDHTVRMWDLDDYESTIVSPQGNALPVVSVKVHENDLYLCNTQALVRRLDLSTLATTFASTLISTVTDRHCMDLSDDGTTLVIAASHGLTVFDLRDNFPVRFTRSRDMVTFCHGLADNSLLCVLSPDHAALYDSNRNLDVLEFDMTRIGSRRATSIYCNHGVLGAAFEGFGIRLWDIHSGNILSDIDNPCAYYPPKCFMFDETKLICGSTQTKAHMYTWGHAFKDKPGSISKFDKAVARKWRTRMQFYQSKFS